MNELGARGVSCFNSFLDPCAGDLTPHSGRPVLRGAGIKLPWDLKGEALDCFLSVIVLLIISQILRRNPLERDDIYGEKKTLFLPYFRFT